MTRQAIAAFFLSVVALAAGAAETPATTAARRLLSEQREAWNRADLEGFMQGYWRSDDVRFAGGDAYRNGWQATLDRYRAVYPDAAAMGKLDFEPLEARELSPSVVYVFGQWRLTRANEAPAKAPHGLFTLLIEQKDGRWVITRDHSSAASN